jgi:long-subunit fatty acid transport protein
MSPSRRRRTSPYRTALLSVGFACAVTHGARANGPDLFGLGARAQAMAGALGANAEGFESVYHNPAGLASDRRPSFTLGYRLASFDLELDGVAREVRDAPALTLGFGMPLPLGGALRDRLSLGLGFVIPQGAILIADLPAPGTPSFILLEDRAQTVSIQASFALRLADWLSVGVGTLALAALEGDIRVEPNAAGRIGSQVRDELIADYALVAGLIARPHPKLSIGVVHRGVSRADFDLPVTADLGSQFPVPLPEINIAGTAQYAPGELSLDLAWAPLPALTWTAGAVWERWSDYPLPLAYSAVPAGYPPQPAPDFADVVSLRTAVEGHLDLGPGTQLRPRLGFAYAPTPTPHQAGFHSHLDNDRAIFGAGVGLRHRGLRADVAVQYQALSRRVHVKAGDADGGAGPTLETGGSVLAGALELGVEL